MPEEYGPAFPAIARIEWIFETFPSVCLSFSGGKDS
ncbi:hypothetical protein, partial [Escherichia coli]